MSWERRNHDFLVAQVDAQVAYIEAEREVKRLEVENAKLRDENERLKEFTNGKSIVTDWWKDEDGTMHVLTTDGEHTYEYERGGIAEENAKLRELLRDLWEYIYIGTAQDGQSLHDRTLELGVEVNE